MATRTAVLSGPTNEGLMKITWTGLLNGDVGSAVRVPLQTDKTAQVFGTPGVGLAVVIEGSNADTPGSTDWGGLKDHGATAISLGDAELALIAEGPEWVRPSVTGDGSTNVTVVITMPAKGR